MGQKVGRHLLFARKKLLNRIINFLGAIIAKFSLKSFEKSSFQEGVQPIYCNFFLFPGVGGVSTT